MGSLEHGYFDEGFLMKILAKKIVVHCHLIFVSKYLLYLLHKSRLSHDEYDNHLWIKIEKNILIISPKLQRNDSDPQGSKFYKIISNSRDTSFV